MGQACSICNHPSRLDIDRAVVQGQSYNSVARRFGVDSNSIGHHSRTHLSRQLVQAYEKKELTEGMNLLGRIDKILLHAEQIFERNFNRRRDIVALKALAEQRCTIDMLARISMYLHAARVAELEAARGHDEEAEALAEAEFARLLCDRLTPPEVELWLQLASKINGESDDPVVYPAGSSDSSYAFSSSSNPSASTTPPRRTRFGPTKRPGNLLPGPSSN